MGDAASVERVNILVDIVISVVLKRLNSDLETVVDLVRAALCKQCMASVVRLGTGLVGSGWPCVRPPRDPGPGRRERCAEGECVLSFYFTKTITLRKRKE